MEELAELHTKMEELKARAFATCVGVEARTPSELQSANKVLRRAIQTQQLECTKIHALMSEYSLFVSLCSGELRFSFRMKLLTRVPCTVLFDAGRTFEWAVLSIGPFTYRRTHMHDEPRCWR